MDGCTSLSAIALSGVVSWSDRILRIDVVSTPAEILRQLSILGLELVDVTKTNRLSVP